MVSLFLFTPSFVSLWLTWDDFNMFQTSLDGLVHVDPINQSQDSTEIQSLGRWSSKFLRFGTQFLQEGMFFFWDALPCVLWGHWPDQESIPANQEVRTRNLESETKNPILAVLVSDSVRDLCCEHGMLSRNFGLLLYMSMYMGRQQEPSELMAETASPGTECLIRLTLQKTQSL